MMPTGTVERAASDHVVALEGLMSNMMVQYGTGAVAAFVSNSTNL